MKKIYKDIVSESFTYEKTEQALASGLEGYEIQAKPLNSSLIASQVMDSKDLLELCLVLYHEDMKALGLNNLLKCYNDWLVQQLAAESAAVAQNE